MPTLTYDIHIKVKRDVTFETALFFANEENLKTEERLSEYEWLGHAKTAHTLTVKDGDDVEIKTNISCE